MREKIFSDESKEKSGTYIYLLSLYFASVGVLYLWGYWSPFGVNILEYISLTDILKSTVYPIASAFFFLALGVMIGQVTHIGPSLPPGEGKNTLPAKFIIRHKRALIILYIIGTLALLFFGPVEKWQLALPLLIAAPITAYARHSNILENQIPAETPRDICLFFLVILPLISFGHGQLKATAVLEGKSFDYVIDNAAITKNTDPLQNTRFIGHAGDFYFFLEPKNSSLTISKFDTGKTLRLRRFERK